MKAAAFLAAIVLAVSAAALPAGDFPLVPRHFGPMAGTRGYAFAAAASRSGHLVVWNETLDGGRVWGVRLTAGGVPVAPGGRIASYFNQPAIASDGDDYLLAAAETPSGGRITLARIDGDSGAVTMPAPIVPGAAIVRHVAIASNGTNYLVFFDRSNAEAAVALVDGNGALVAPVASVATSQTGFDALNVAAAGRDFFLAWKDNTDGKIRTRVVSEAGIRHESVPATVPVIEPRTLTVTGAAAASAGDVVLIVWQMTNDVSYRLFDAFGAPLSGVTTLTVPNGGGVPAAVWDGTQFIAGFRTMEGFAVVRIAKDGTRLDDAPELVKRTSSSVKLSGRNATPILLTSDTNLYSDLLTGGVTRVITESPALVAKASAVWRGDHYLVVWNETSDGFRMRTYMNRVALDGTMLDGAGVLLFERNPQTSLPAWTIDTDGTNALLAWGDLEGVHTLFIDRDLRITQRSLTPPGYGQTSVRWNGSEYLVAFLSEDHLVGMRVDRYGMPADPVPVPLAPLYGFLPSAGWNGSEYVIASFEQLGRCTNDFDDFRIKVRVRADRVSKELTGLRTEILSEPTCKAPDSLAIRSTPEGWVVTWAVETETRAARLFPNAAPTSGANGVYITNATRPALDLTGGDALVLVGRYAWPITPFGEAGARRLAYAFVPEDAAEARVNRDGPVPLVLYKTAGPLPEVIGHFLPPRVHAVRH